MKLRSVILFFVFFNCNSVFAQGGTNPYVKDVLKANRERLYQNLVKNTITKNLSLSLSDSTEENWTDAFGAMELIRYKSPWVNNRIRSAFDSIDKRSVPFQRSLLELCYSIYPGFFVAEINSLLNKTDDEKVFAMCAEYLVLSDPKAKGNISALAKKILLKEGDHTILQQVLYRFDGTIQKTILPPLKEILTDTFFRGAKLVISFQRKNRNYPGMVVVRDSAGNFMKDSYGNYFAVPQLARSLSNLPGYLSNGNTPQGIFRMDGFAVSRSNFIGPTTNIQLTMPFETSIRHFMNDSAITDSVWTEDWYKKLLPAGWKNYFPAYESYYAGKAGRTEIIAHGTTIDPAYYQGQPYYPITPTLGCLCTKEIWSEETGQRLESNQQKLVDVLQQAGGPDGYYFVLELNDEQRPVTLQDIETILK